MNPRVASVAVVLFATASLAAQNRDHPGLVFVDKLGWVTRDDARKKGCFEHERRWFPASTRKQLEAWAKEDKKSAAWENARTLKTTHYRVVSNVPRFILELEIAPFLDELYETYVKVFKEHYGLESRAANQKTIKIHCGYQDYRAHEADANGPPPRATPAFIVNGEELVCFYDDTDPANFYGSVFHEGAHQFMGAVLPGAELPVWLDEAMATYFEGCTWSRATKKLTVGFVPPDRLAHAQELLRPVAPPAEGSLADQMFAQVPREKFEAEHYALAWSFVYHLLNRDGGRYRKPFAAFLRATNGSGTRPIPEIWKRATRTELAVAEQGWREAVLSWKAAAAPTWATVEIKTPDPAVDVKDGDLAWSIDGVEVFDEQGAGRAWQGRAKDRAATLVLVRRTKSSGPEQYSERFVLVEVPPDSPLGLEWSHDPNRAFNLRD